MEFENLKLNNVNNGAIEDLFNNELDKILRNINDLNVSPDAVREVRIVVKIKPSKDRLTATTSVMASSKLAPTTPNDGSIFLSFTGNQPKAFNNHQKQMTIDDIKKQ